MHMIANKLLAFATRKAKNHIKKVINSKNKEDYRKLNKLFDKKLFEAKNFADTELDISKFDWQNLKKDRNWWWQLQALPFLSWFINSFELQDAEERLRNFSLCTAAILCWNERAKQNAKSPLVWHDHATAFRVRNLVNWLLFCDIVKLPIRKVAYIDSLANLVVEHLDWLSDDQNYSKHTNHGFDQAMIALTISLMFDRDDFDSYRQCHRERLIDELNFAFTEEGVHKENSPGYQKYMLGRLRALVGLRGLGENIISTIADKYVKAAEKFLEAITLPNGYLPAIGDTLGNDPGLKKEIDNCISIFDYSASGYVIVKGIDRLEKEFCLIFKNCHYSNYHRHDDDLSIFFYYDGRVIFGDGGLYSHEEKNPKRIFFRSNRAHSVPLLDGAVERNQNRLKSSPVTYLKGRVILGISYAYGVELRRQVDFSEICNGSIRIIDSTPSDVRVSSNFLVPDLDSSIFDGEVAHLSIAGVDVSVNSGAHGTRFSLFSGWNSKSLYDSAIVSSVYKKFKNIHRVVLNSLDEKLDCYIKFGPAKKTPIYTINYRGQKALTLFSVGNSWNFDNEYPGNFCHHVLSLRWLSDIKDLNVLSAIIKDFVNFHKSEESFSKFYEGRIADHTSAIRVDSLIKAKNRLKGFDSQAFNLCVFELNKTVNNILSGKSYKEKNNHGLSGDIALLKANKEPEIVLSEDQISTIKKRYRNQLMHIFTEAGEVREHSVSYQEYNCNLVLDLKLALSSAGVKDVWIDDFWPRLLESTKKILGFSLKSNGEYFAVGDTFSFPNNRLIHRIFSCAPEDAFSPYSTKHGMMLSPGAGLSSIRNSVFHCFFTSSWNSYVHKQDDDLSVSLAYQGIDVLLDAGYSDILPRADFDFYSAENHSNFGVSGAQWLTRSNNHEGFSRLTHFVSSGECKAVVGQHSRISGFVARRCIGCFRDDLFFIHDYIDSCSNTETEHRFIIPKEFELKVNGNRVLINIGEGITLYLSVQDKGSWRIQDGQIVHDNKLLSVNKLVFSGYGDVTFVISTYEINLSPKVIEVDGKYLLKIASDISTYNLCSMDLLTEFPMVVH